MILTPVTMSDDLATICAELSPEKWGKDNDMALYTPESLEKFLGNTQNMLVVGRVDNQIVCSVLGYILNHPDPSRKSLYIDELDTHPDHRRQGYASEMIGWLRAYADKHGLKEVWLATESEDNQVANDFYKSLHPTENVPCNLYSYSTADRELS